MAARKRDKFSTSVDQALEEVQRKMAQRAGVRQGRKRAAPASAKAGADEIGRESYFQLSRSLSAGFIASLPLLAIYEIGVLSMVGRDINAAAQIFKAPISWLKSNPTELLGTDPILIINGVLIVAALFALWRLGQRGGLNPGTFGGMFVESVTYALLLGPLALFMLTGRLQFGGFNPDFSAFGWKVVASAGAGLYEELIFRAILLGAIYTVCHDGLNLRPFTAGALGLLLSGAVFSAAHFLSPGETANYPAFLYRLFAGMFLGGIFLTRGFGIAAWTHALYDIYILCFAGWKA